MADGGDKAVTMVSLRGAKKRPKYTSTYTTIILVIAHMTVRFEMCSLATM